MSKTIEAIVDEMEAAMKKTTAGEWLHIDNLIYVLEHDGWRKGEETFRNRLTCPAYFHKDVPQEEMAATVASITLTHNHLAQVLADWRRLAANEQEYADDRALIHSAAEILRQEELTK